MNAKTETEIKKPFANGERVEIMSTDHGNEQAGTIGMFGVIEQADFHDGALFNPYADLVDVRLEDGRLITYLTDRLRAAARADTPPQATDNRMLPTLDELIATGKIIELVVPDETKALKYSIGTQVLITGTEWLDTGKNPSGLFGMIIKTGPLYGHNDSEKVYDYGVHTTDGRNISINECDISPVVDGTHISPDHPVALMQKLGALRSQEKHLMSSLSRIRHAQHIAEIRANSLRTCGDKVREDRAVIVKQCEELEFELTRAIAAAA